MIRSQGFRGQYGMYGMVALYVRRMRQAQGLAPRQRRSDQPLPVVTEAPRRRLPPRQATWLVLRPSARSTNQDRHQLAQLTTQAPELAEAVALAQDFAALVRQRQPTQLDSWLARATTSALAPFRRFAKGLREDYAAVQAGVTRPWSQGPLEGHINRLKMLKRLRCLAGRGSISSPDASCWPHNVCCSRSHARRYRRRRPQRRRRDTPLDGSDAGEAWCPHDRL
jgi:transposase